MNQNNSNASNSLYIFIAIASAVLVVLFLLLNSDTFPSSSSTDKSLTVYCAHDSIHAQQVFDAFTKQTGIEVVIRYDTEATKSLGLIEQIISEKDNPQCDVFWNNELLGTLDLHSRGAFEPYQGTGRERIPDAYKDEAGHWTGFGARMRVWIINTEKIPEPTQEDIGKRLDSEDLSQIAMADPLYGTTLTHYTLLSHLWGIDQLKTWHAELRKKGLREVRGNAVSKNLVAQGLCDLGWTDTDDYFVAVKEGAAVTFMPVLVNHEGQQHTIAIPNTVGIIKGTANRATAEQFIDFLVSEQVELMLANAQARQIPLGSVDESKLNAQVKALRKYVPMGYPLDKIQQSREPVITWLKGRASE